MESDAKDNVILEQQLNMLAMMIILHHVGCALACVYHGHGRTQLRQNNHARALQYRFKKKKLIMVLAIVN